MFPFEELELAPLSGQLGTHLNEAVPELFGTEMGCCAVANFLRVLEANSTRTGAHKLPANVHPHCVVRWHNAHNDV